MAVVPYSLCLLGRCALRAAVGALALIGLFLAESTAIARANVLREAPVPSPDKAHAANVEWEDVGFLGVIRMVIGGRDGKPAFHVEVPEVNPQPASLQWLDNDWVACASFLGPKAGAFFYVHVPSRRGYLIEIFESSSGNMWQFGFATNDDLSSATIATYSSGRDSVFPIVLRDPPETEAEYFTVQFAARLRAAIEPYLAFRRKHGFRELDLLCEPAVKPEWGAVVAVALDGKPELIWFPAGATSTDDLLARVKRQAIPRDQAVLLTPESGAAPVIRAQWLPKQGEYRIEVEPPASSRRKRLVLEGRFEGVQDRPYLSRRLAENPEEATVDAPATKPLRERDTEESGGEDLTDIKIETPKPKK
ncbi:MAG: hypothetical protein N2111_05185 [Candidatus Sumerlaeaceae bacterium]|nr:hypothetical protein [Candidatus Sumerlaeaceae bacterium]